MCREKERVSGFCDIILLLYYFVTRKIITSANGCISEGASSKTEVSDYKNNLSLRLYPLRDLSENENDWRQPIIKEPAACLTSYRFSRATRRAIIQ